MIAVSSRLSRLCSSIIASTRFGLLWTPIHSPMRIPAWIQLRRRTWPDSQQDTSFPLVIYPWTRMPRSNTSLTFPKPRWWTMVSARTVSRWPVRLFATTRRLVHQLGQRKCFKSVRKSTNTFGELMCFKSTQPLTPETFSHRFGFNSFAHLRTENKQTNMCKNRFCDYNHEPTSCSCQV